MKKFELINKKLGETPLESLERFRSEKILSDSDSSAVWTTIPMTYAGRLDPMAEGELLILIGEECKNKEKYLGLDKEYEVEILFGISTDTYDALGLAEYAQGRPAQSLPASINLDKYVGKFAQVYPAYSSKTVNGKQLHELARTNNLPDEMPKREVEIYEIEVLVEGRPRQISVTELKTRILKNIDLVKGDFRQAEIIAKWNEVLNDSGQLFDVIKIRVKCSGGTYMRSLADRMGRELGTGAMALSIKRTRIFLNE